ncbi:hypothetical protein X975_09204, partial [Stegodyphus mimosarum]
MGKKKRVSNNSGDNLNSEADNSSNSKKEISSTVPDSDTCSEHIPIFKNPKFVLAKTTPKKSRVWKSLRQITAVEKALPRVATYTNIDAPASIKPPKKYSDISGLEAKYTDPQTKLRFANASEFQLIRTLQPEAINAYLSLRKAALV